MLSNNLFFSLIRYSVNLQYKDSLFFRKKLSSKKITFVGLNLLYKKDAKKTR